MKRTRIQDYTPDMENANAHSERGVGMLETSIAQTGLGRSIVVDMNGIILAGNSTQERAIDQGFEDAIEVETDGNQLVVVRRKDLDLMNDPDHRARLHSILDNRAAETGIVWEPEVLESYRLQGVPLDKAWTPVELDGCLYGLSPADDGEWASAAAGLPDGERAPFQQMTFTLHDDQIQIVIEALKQAKSMGSFDSPNENSNGNALTRICESFVTANG